MVPIANQPAAPDAATLELWRVAETDDVEALKRMWAKAVTCLAVAQGLESRTPASRSTPAPVPPRTTSAPAPPLAVKTPRTPLVVKTLKDPPEIWDLVHEVPRDFNPKSAFLSRLG